MLEQLSTLLGFPFNLAITGLIVGLVIVCYKKHLSLFLKILYVIICVFSCGYSDQFLLLVGFKAAEGTEVVRGFIVSFLSTYIIGALKSQAEKFESNPLKYIKNLKSKNDETGT